ncbi:MAG: hypothetical protein B7Y93_00895 [Micrococcales bacterium 32-70-13]|nr:MAG: hypothetical protein B7Y93_00895 [Micrococcales bacterium 32-70-13]
MSMFESAKDAAKATGEKVGDWVEEQKDRLDDKADEIRADGEVARKEAELKKARADREAVEAKNDYKDDLRD